MRIFLKRNSSESSSTRNRVIVFNIAETYSTNQTLKPLCGLAKFAVGRELAAHLALVRDRDASVMHRRRRRGEGPPFGICRSCSTRTTPRHKDRDESRQPNGGQGWLCTWCEIFRLGTHNWPPKPSSLLFESLIAPENPENTIHHPLQAKYITSKPVIPSAPSTPVKKPVGRPPHHQRMSVDGISDHEKYRGTPQADSPFRNSRNLRSPDAKTDNEPPGTPKPWLSVALGDSEDAPEGIEKLRHRKMFIFDFAAAAAAGSLPSTAGASTGTMGSPRDPLSIKSDDPEMVLGDPIDENVIDLTAPSAVAGVKMTRENLVPAEFFRTHQSPAISSIHHHNHLHGNGSASGTSSTSLSTYPSSTSSGGHHTHSDARKSGNHRQDKRRISSVASDDDSGTPGSQVPPTTDPFVLRGSSGSSFPGNQLMRLHFKGNQDGSHADHDHESSPQAQQVNPSWLPHQQVHAKTGFHQSQQQAKHTFKSSIGSFAALGITPKQFLNHQHQQHQHENHHQQLSHKPYSGGQHKKDGSATRPVGRPPKNPALPPVSTEDERAASHKLVELAFSDYNVPRSDWVLDQMLVTPGNPRSELLALPTTRLADACRLLGITIPNDNLQMLSPSWASFPSCRMVGQAFTVTIFPHPDATNIPPHPERHSPEYVDLVRPGDVVVVGMHESMVSKGAYWEYLQSKRAKHIGAVGTVIDGHIRDAEMNRELGYFAFGRGMKMTRASVGSFELSKRVVIDGVTVSSRDWVVGDVNGVIFIPNGRLDEVLRIAKEIQSDLMDIDAELEEGKALQAAQNDNQYRL